MAVAGIVTGSAVVEAVAEIGVGAAAVKYDTAENTEVEALAET